MAEYRRDAGKSSCNKCGRETEHEEVYRGDRTGGSSGREWQRTGKSSTSGWAREGGRGCKECGSGDCGYENATGRR